MTAYLSKGLIRMLVSYATIEENGDLVSYRLSDLRLLQLQIANVLGSEANPTQL